MAMQATEEDPMGALDDLVYAARVALIAAERAEAEVLAARYARLATQIAATTADLSTAIAAAGPDAAAPGWLERQALYAQLQRGTGYQMRQVGRFAATRLAAQQRRMLVRGEAGGLALLRAQGAQADRLDALSARALELEAAARLASYDLPRTLPALAIQIVRIAAAKVALLGLAAGDIGERLRRGFGGVLTRLLFLARNEAVTPYRDATAAVFAANGVVRWQWFTEIEQVPPPCGMCVAMHGQIFAMDAAFATHLGCRCLPVPVLAASALPVQVGGKAWLDVQDAATRKLVLGASKLQHYESGLLQLQDLVGEELLPDGRAARRERSLVELGLDRVRPAREVSR